MKTRPQIAIIRVLQGTLVGAGVLAGFAQDWSVLFVSLLTLFVTFLPSILRRNRSVQLPIEFHLFIVLFIYATLFLGEVADFYELFWWWDIILHSSSGLAFGVIGFIMLYTLHGDRRVIIRPLTSAVFTFSFALAVGALWEIFEFSLDQLFGLNMQKSGLNDTMWDLIVDAVGGIVAGVVGYFYVIRRGKGKGYLSTLIREYFTLNTQNKKKTD